MALPGLSRGPNIAGVTANMWAGTGLVNNGTLPGVYGDLGIFFSTAPETAYGSSPVGNITNNSGDIVGNRTSLGRALNKWDTWQMAGFGIAGTTVAGYPSSPIIDSNGRGNTGWGLASAVAGPQNGYAWQFDLDAYKICTGGSTAPNASCINTATQQMGPWQRIQTPGGQIAYDTPGDITAGLFNGGLDGSNVGFDLSPATPLTVTTGQSNGTPNAIRFALGQLTYQRPEYVWVKIKVTDPTALVDATGCPVFQMDTFGGDAGGDSGGKDHIWRYYDPNGVSTNGCLAVGKPATRDIVKVGDNFQYNIKVYNLGNKTLSNVIIRDTLPSGVTFVSAVPAQNSGPNPLQWNVGNFLPGQKFEATVTVTASGVGILTNCIQATGNPSPIETTTVNACEKTPSGAIPYLTQTKSVTPASVAPGATVQYTIDVDNIGTGPTGSPVIITEDLPTGFTYVSKDSVTINGANVTAGTTVNSANLSAPIFTVPAALNAGQSLILKFTAQVAANQASGEYCNSFRSSSPTNLSTGALACVTVGGGKIGDTIFRDWNGNGVQDADEEGMPGVTVSLTKPDSSVVQAVSDATGKYIFTGLDAGTYTVTVPAPGSGGVPTGFTLMADPNGAPISNVFTHTLTLNEQYLDADFGYQPGGTGSIGDLLFEDKSNDGAFTIGTDGPITKTVTVWLYEDTNGDGVIDPIADTKIMTTTTNPANGTYSFTGLAQGLNYIVQVDESDTDLAAYFSPNSFVNTTGATQSVTNLTGSYTAADFGYFALVPSSIGDEVCIDSNSDGSCAGETLLPGVTVLLYKDGEPFKTTTTNITGTYSFEGLGPGSYTVIVDTTDPDVPAGYFPSTNNIAVTLGVGENRTDVDFPFVQLISKQVDKLKVDDNGATLTYTVTASYPGSALLTNVVVTDTVPAGTTYVADSDTPEATVTPADNNTATLLTWNLGSNSAGVPGYTSASGGSGTITLVMTSTAFVRGGTSLSPAKPAGTVEGDVLVAGVSAQDGSDVTITPPSGWTLIRRTDSGTSHAEAAYYKVAGASETATYTFTVASSTRWSIGISAYRGVDTANPIDTDAAQANASSTNAVAPSVTTTSANTMLVGIFASKIGAVSGQTANPPAGMTER